MPPPSTSSAGRLSSTTPAPRLSAGATKSTAATGTPSRSASASKPGSTKPAASTTNGAPSSKTLKTASTRRVSSTTATTEAELAACVIAEEEVPHTIEEARSRVGALELWPGAFSPTEAEREKKVVWLDIDNTLYKKSTRIAELMSERIRAYFLSLGLAPAEAEALHTHYYKSYGLAIRGLVKHHQIDPIDYDERCDASLPLEQILRPDERVKSLLKDLDRRKCRVFALTNAYKTHALRVLKLLELEDMIEGVIFCDYASPDFVCKPENAFYQAAMSYVGATDPAKNHFVDDSLLNIKAAQQLGWGSCVFFREEEEETEAEPATQADVAQAAAFDVGALVPSSNGASNGDLSAGAFDEAKIKAQFQALPANMRIKLLNIVLDAAMPGDLAAIQRSLERHLRMTRDLISGLPEAVCIRIFERLEVKELLRCRQVSKKWLVLAARPELWRSHALALTESDPVQLAPPKDALQWESLVKGLYFRERNWANGIAQRVELMHGHTGFVTAMKLKGRNTLVTGSYDETIRVWELSTGKCKKVIKAKAISCLDFLPEEGVLAAGLYDAGRIMVWNMRTWELTHTLTGHNRGIRSLALGSRHLVTVGQDKAIIVWDWRTGAKLSRWGQQSNVSLGVSIIDDDKVVAVTVDGIIRTFSIRKNEMIGQYHISKLAGDNRALSVELAGLGGDANMMLWFAAHRRTITVASKDVVVHLEWHEHVVPVEEYAEASRSGTPSLRSSDSTPSRTRKDSTQSNASAARPPSSMRMSVSTPSIAASSTRTRRDSLESNASTATAASSAPRRSVGPGASAMSPTTSRKSLPRVSGGLATPSRPQPALDRQRSLNRPNPPSWPAPPNSAQKQPSMPSSPSLPNSPFAGSLSALQGLGDSAALSPTTPTHTHQPMRIAPNLSIPPRLVDVIRMPDGATGCVDPGKRRVVSASRFSSRAGADRRLYATTLSEGDEDVATRAGEEERRKVVPIGGAWQAMSKELAQPAHNPMSMILDHESCVYGTSSGLCVRMSFLGHEYRQGWIDEQDEAADTDVTSAQAAANSSSDYVTVADLVQLRDVWSDLMLPANAAPDHPGRFTRPSSTA